MPCRWRACFVIFVAGHAVLFDLAISYIFFRARPRFNGKVFEWKFCFIIHNKKKQIFLPWNLKDLYADIYCQYLISIFYTISNIKLVADIKSIFSLPIKKWIGTKIAQICFFEQYLSITPDSSLFRTSEISHTFSVVDAWTGHLYQILRQIMVDNWNSKSVMLQKQY